MIEESNSKSMMNTQVAPPIEKPISVSKSQDMIDIEPNNTHSKLYEGILQESYNLLFIKIFYNLHGKGQIKLLDYVFMKVKFLPNEKKTLNPYLKRALIMWEFCLNTSKTSIQTTIGKALSFISNRRRNMSSNCLILRELSLLSKPGKF